MPSGAYSHTSLQNLIDQTSQELGDPGQTFYVSLEIQFALQESLRVWNMLTGWNRTTEYFQTTPGVAFYDLTTVLTNLPQSRTVDIQDALGQLQYHLMEPYEPIASVGVSEMYTHASLVRTIQQRRDRFLAETHCLVTQRAPIPVGAGAGLVLLDDHTITIVRAVWKTDDGRYISIDTTDESMATSFIPSWRQNRQIPRAISLTTQPELTVQLIPEPSFPGELHLFTIESGAPLITSPDNTLLGVPDDMSWGLVWGAAFDLLMRDGIGRAPSLAAFAEQLYNLSVPLSRQLPTVLTATINNKMIHPVALDMLDSMRQGWEGRSWDVPTQVGILGDYLALQPVPDAQYSIGVTMVKKTPLYAPGDPIQLGREQLAAIVGWAKQLLLFKKGGVQLQQGVRCAQDMFTQAKIYNEERIFMSSYLTELYSLSTDDPWTPLRTRTGQSEPGESDTPDPADNSSTRQPRSGSRRLGGR